MPMPAGIPGPELFKGRLSFTNYLVPMNEAPSGYLVRHEFKNGLVGVDPLLLDFDKIAFTEGQPLAPYGLYVDTYDCTGPVTVRFDNLYFRVVVPANSSWKGNYPGVENQKVTVEGSAPGDLVTLIFVNYPVI